MYNEMFIKDDDISYESPFDSARNSDTSQWQINKNKNKQTKQNKPQEILHRKFFVPSLVEIGSSLFLEKTTLKYRQCISMRS